MNPIIAAAYLLLGQPGATQPVLVANIPAIDCPAPPCPQTGCVKSNHLTVRLVRRGEDHHRQHHHRPAHHRRGPEFEDQG